MPESSSRSRESILAGAASWHLLALIIAGSVTLYTRFFRSSFFAFFEDDFFYYVQVAKNLALHGHSTFDGVHATNGYHPLWLLLLTLLYKILPGISFFIAAQTVALACSVAIYLALLRCFRALAIPLSTSRAAALLLSMHALLLLRYGMEVTLAIPLALWALALYLSPEFFWTPSQTAVFSLLACTAVLARIDIILLFAILVPPQLLTMPLSKALRRAGLILLCFTPLFLYLIVNYCLFHTFLPISGLAKELKPLFPPSPVSARSLILPFDRMKAVFVYPALLALFLGSLQLLHIWNRLQPRLRQTFAILLLFPVLHTLLLSFIGDWPVWPWYFYSFVFSTVAATMIALLSVPVPVASHTRTSTTVVFSLYAASLCYFIYIAGYAVAKPPSRMALLSADMAAFAQQHPGTYAMGDQAGTTAYLAGQPFVQLEGLMMDGAYLDNIRHRSSVSDVLQRYHADYYINLYLDTPTGCFQLSEPAQGGPHSPHMRGHICALPLATFTESDTHMSVFRAADVEP